MDLDRLAVRMQSCVRLIQRLKYHRQTDPRPEVPRFMTQDRLEVGYRLIVLTILEEQQRPTVPRLGILRPDQYRPVIHVTREVQILASLSDLRALHEKIDSWTAGEHPGVPDILFQSGRLGLSGSFSKLVERFLSRAGRSDAGDKQAQHPYQDMTDHSATII